MLIIVNLLIITLLNSTNLFVEYIATFNIIFIFIAFSLNCFDKDFIFFIIVDVVCNIVIGFIINKGLNCFRRSLNLCIAFDTPLIVIVKIVTSTNRSFALIEFDKLEICLIYVIDVDLLLRSVEIDDKNERFEDSFN